ncbi:hypothetical protein GCM10020255_046440 [Rhodococcus baikonurensis]
MDSVVFDERALRLLVDTVGVDRVMVGSDYPYPLGERPVGEVVRKSEFLDDTARQLISRGMPNASWVSPEAPAIPFPVWRTVNSAFVSHVSSEHNSKHNDRRRS